MSGCVSPLLVLLVIFLLLFVFALHCFALNLLDCSLRLPLKMEEKKEVLHAYDDSTLKHEFRDSSPAEKESLPTTLPTDPATEKLLNRKFDTHILPWLFGMWLLAFIDRANIGNAKIDGLVEDLNLTGNKFNVSLAIFYVPYICVDVPSNLVLKYFKAGHYLPGLLVCWGLTATFMGFVKSYGGLLAVSILSFLSLIRRETRRGEDVLC